jgi:short subunit dehydrogenase-like uncharacterized protein
MSGKAFDVVVFGATGFTGSLVARYLAAEAESALGGSPDTLKWAIAGRSEAKLRQVKQTLKDKVPEVAPELIDALPTVVADSADEQSLVAMVKQTKVVLSLVGPYTLYGSLLVKACAENGVHYCDLTGEILWVSDMVAKYQTAAEKSGAILINCCGFESIPSDLTAFLIADKIQEKYNSKTSQVDLYFSTLKGEASGGTLATIFTMMETSTSKQLIASRNPFFLTDAVTMATKKEERLVGANTGSMAIKHDKTMGLWSSFFVGASVNQAIVHRSNFLLHGKYGDKFVYRERMAIGGLFAQIVATLGIAVVGVMLYFWPTRALLKRLARSPGEGPSEESMRDGYFIVDAAGYSEDGKLAVKAKTIGTGGDPGYRLTSRIISECAMCLAKGEVAAAKGGFYTPASALGHHLAGRLERKKFVKFELKEQQ